MAGPHINSLDPNTVKKDTAVTVRVKGSNFNDASFVFVDGASPACKYVSSTEVTVELSKQHTSTAGKKSVKVHNANDGTLSNEVSLTVV
jgi:IPT/TIG domain-containing protein